MFYTPLILFFTTLSSIHFTTAIPLPYPQNLSPTNPSAVNILMTSDSTNASSTAVSIPIDNAWHCISSETCYNYEANSSHPFDLSFPMSGPDSLCSLANVSTIVNGGGANCTVHVPSAAANETYVVLPWKDVPFNYTIAGPVARVCCGDCPVTNATVPTEILGNGTESTCGSVLAKRSTGAKWFSWRD